MRHYQVQKRKVEWRSVPSFLEISHALCVIIDVDVDVSINYTHTYNNSEPNFIPRSFNYIYIFNHPLYEKFKLAVRC